MQIVGSYVDEKKYRQIDEWRDNFKYRLIEMKKSKEKRKQQKKKQRDENYY